MRTSIRYLAKNSAKKATAANSRKIGSAKTLALSATNAKTRKKKMSSWKKSYANLPNERASTVPQHHQEGLAILTLRRCTSSAALYGINVTVSRLCTLCFLSRFTADQTSPSDYSHPRPSDIERDEGDPEYLPVEGLGNCFDCSAAPASVIQQMKQNGDFDKEDPWGAMSRTEVAEGSSRGADLPSLEEIAYGMKHSDSDQHAAVSPPSSPEMTGGRPRSAGSLESDDDLGPAKGKGRLGEPIRQPAHAAMVDSDESDTEETPHNKSKKSGHLVMHQAEEETDSEAGTADEEDDEEDKVSHRLHQSKERPPHAPSVSDDDEDDEKHFSGNEEAHGKAPRWGQGTAHHTDSDEEFDPGSDGLSDAESDGEDEHGQNDKHSNKGKAAGAPTIIKKT